MRKLTIAAIVAAVGAASTFCISRFRKQHRLNLPIERTPYSEGEFPDEIYHLIFSHLQPEDLSRCSRVCRTWNVLTKASDLWSRFDYHDIVEQPQSCSSPGCIWCSLYAHMRNLFTFNGINPFSEQMIPFYPRLSSLRLHRLVHYGVGASFSFAGMWLAYKSSGFDKIPSFAFPLGMALGFLSPGLLREHTQFKSGLAATAALVGAIKTAYDIVGHRNYFSMGWDLLYFGTRYSHSGREGMARVLKSVADFVLHPRFEVLYRGPVRGRKGIFAGVSLLSLATLFWYFPLVTGNIVINTIGLGLLASSIEEQPRATDLGVFYFVAVCLWNFRIFGSLSKFGDEFAFLGIIAGFLGTHVCLNSTRLLSIPALLTALMFIFRANPVNRVCWVLLLVFKLFFQRMLPQPVWDVRLLPCQHFVQQLSSLFSFRRSTQQQGGHSTQQMLKLEGTDVDTSTYESMVALQSVRTRWLSGTLQSTHLRREHPSIQTWWNPDPSAKHDGLHYYETSGKVHHFYSPLGFHSASVYADLVIPVSDDRLLVFNCEYAPATKIHVSLFKAYTFTKLAACEVSGGSLGASGTLSDTAVAVYGKYFVAASQTVQLFELSTLTLVCEVPLTRIERVNLVTLNLNYVVVTTGTHVYIYRIIREEEQPLSASRHTSSVPLISLIQVSDLVLWSLGVQNSINEMKLSTNNILYCRTSSDTLSAFDVGSMEKLFERKHVTQLGVIAGGSVVVLVRKGRLEICDPGQKQTVRKINVESCISQVPAPPGFIVHFGYDFIFYSNPPEGDRQLECYSLMLRADHVL